MVTWEQIIALPEYQQASPEKKEKAKQAYLSLMKSKAEKGNRDILGGSVVTSGVEKANEQRKQEAEVQRKARAQMGNMRARGVRVPEEEPLRTPVYDPVDLAVDAATGFMGSAGKAALRAGAKAIAKNVAREVGTGAVAGAGMVAADKMGAGALGQLAAGLGSATAGGAALTGARRLVASMIRRGIPEGKAAQIVADMNPDTVERALHALGDFEEPVRDLPASFVPDKTDESLRRAAENVERWSAPLEEAGVDYRRGDVPPKPKVPPAPPVGVEDNPRPVAKVEQAPLPTREELLEGQRSDFIPEEAVPQRGSIDYDERIGQRVIPLPAGVKALPEGVTRGRDGKLYVTISNSPRGKVKVAQEAIQAVPEVAVKPEPVAPVTEYPTLTRHTKGEIEQLIEEETDKLVSEIPRLPRHRAKEIAGARLVMRYGDEFDRLRKAIRGGDHRPEILALDEGATFSPHNINEQVVDLTGTRTLLIDQDVTNEQLAKQFEHGDAIPDVKETPYYMGQYFPEPYRASSVKFKDSDGIPVTVNATFHGDIGIHKSFSGDGYTVRVGDDIIADGISRRKATDVARDFWTKHINPDLAPKAPTGVAPSVPKALPKAPAVEAPKVEAPARKQPWEMTGDDFATLHLWADAYPSKIKELGLGDWDKEALDLQVRGLANGDSILEDELSRAFWTDPRERDAAHRVFVKKALSAGKPVPPEVLAEYPDLAPKQGIAPPVPKADVPVELPKVGAGPTVFNTNTTYSMGPKEYTYPKWLPNKLNSFNEQNIPAVTENISIYTPEGIYTVMPGGSSRLQDFSEEQFAKVLSRYSDPDEISVPHNKAFRDLVANRKSEIDNAFEQHFAERGITVGGKKAKKGVAPSVPKAAMADNGGLGIVSDEFKGKVPQPIRRFFGGLLEYRYGQPGDYKQIAEGALNTTAYVSTQARKMVDNAKDAAKKAKVSDSDALSYLQGYTNNVPPEVARELDGIRQAIDKWGDEAVKEGLLSPEKRKAGYLARLYERHLIDAYEPTLEARQGAIDWLKRTKNASTDEEAEAIIQNILEGNGVKLVNGPAIPAKLDMGRFMERQDVPYPIRQLLGEVSNPYYLAYRSIKDVARDVTQVKLFKQIAENPLWASKTAKPGFVKINTDALPKGMLHALDTMRDKWGDIGGLYIKKEIAEDLKKTYAQAGEYAQMAQVLQSTWKMMKVPMNPATVTTNIISNSILSHLGGVPLWKQAVKLPDAMLNVIRSRKGNMDPIYKALEDNHLFTGNYTENELGLLYEGFSLAMNRTKNNGLRLAYALQWAVKKAGGQKAADFYGAVEDTFKYMLAKEYVTVGRGPSVQDMLKGRFGKVKLTPEQAVKEAELWLFNYRQLPEPLKAMRRTVLPFISWPYFSGKAMARAVLNYPHRVLPILGLGYAIDEHMKDKGKDIKLSKYLPYFDTVSEDWGTLGGVPIPPNLQPGGLAVIPIEAYLGRSIYGDREIFSADDPKSVKAQKGREYLWNSLTPPLLGYSGERLLNAATGTPKNRYGDVESLGTAVAGSLAGVQVRPDTREVHLREIKRLMGKEQQEKNYLTWYLKQGYSDADKRERIELARQRIAEFRKERDEAVKAFREARQ